jgi:hypothetical protein
MLLGAMTSTLQAQDLSQQIETLFGPQGLQLAIGGPFPPHTAHFSSTSFATLGLLTRQLAPSAADVPAISTVPGFTYRYSPELRVFERSSASLGSIFVERPQTIGKGKFDVGFSYLYISYDELNGQDLDGLTFSGLEHGDCCTPIGTLGDPVFEQATADITFDKFNLRSQVVSFFGTYGITDRWNVNILIPIVFTSLEVNAHAHLNDVDFVPSPGLPPVQVHRFPNGTTDVFRTVDDNATGVGDILLRTKYQFFESTEFNMASGLNLRVPTGNEDNFQGIGHTTLTPYLVLAQNYGPFDLHGFTGIEIFTGQLDLSRVRYAAGVTYQVTQKLALIADVIGSSGLTSNTITVQVPQFTEFSTTPTGFTPQSMNIRTDIVDLAVGFKFNPYRSMVGFFNVFVPLNDDGLRADVIPTAGLEMSF